jgi:very-short-patch-repair endonuclease
LSDLNEFSKLLTTTKYAGTCTVCKRHISVGEPSYWSQRRRQICCVACKRGRQASDSAVSGTSKGAVSSATGPIPDPATSNSEWKRLISFLRESVVASASQSVLSLEEANQRIIAATPAQIVRGGGGPNQFDPRLVLNWAKADSETSMVLGWPFLTMTDASGATSAVPIFICSLSVDATDPDEIAVVRDSDLGINPSLLAREGLGLSLAEALIEIMGDDAETPSDSALESYIVQAAQGLSLRIRGFEGQGAVSQLGAGDGLHDASVILPDDGSATMNLLKELDQLANRTDWQSTAAASLIDRLGSKTSKITRTNAIPLLAPLRSNVSQEAVLEAALGERLTVVTGPPGTGKSQTVVNLIANSWAQGRSVLLASTNNAAVDVAVDRSEELAPGMLLRTGKKDLREALPNLVTRVVKLSESVPPEDWAKAESQLASVAKKRVEYINNLELLASLERDLLSGLINEEKIRNSLSIDPTLDLSRDATRLLVARLRRIQSWPVLWRMRFRRVLRPYGIEVTRQLEGAYRIIDWLAVHLENLERPIRIGALGEKLGDRNVQLPELESAWRDASAEFVRLRVSDSVSKNKGRFSALAGSRSGHGGMLRSIEELSTGFKGWASTLLTLRSNFPLKAGSFDTVIIDEASQCHLAYVLPAAYRAKHLVVVGDPNQLQPITSLTEDQEEAIGKRVGVSADETLDRRLSSVRDSAFDSFGSVVGDDGIKLLNEHYRCHPRIARWFNQVFYGSRLEVLTDLSDFDLDKRAITWTDVAGTAERPGGQAVSWVNLDEAHAVVELLKAESTAGVSVGIVTPFRAQSNLIESLVKQEMGPEELGSIQFRAGTAHRFQGDERDVMIFSCVVAPGMTPSAAKWVESDRRLINVAVSRARHRLHVVGSPTLSQFNIPTLISLREFILAASEEDDERVAPQFASESERRLYNAAIDSGLQLLTKINVEGYELDFALFSGTKRYDIEVDGDQHLDGRGRNCRQDIARDAVLTRAGWTVIRVSAWRCYKDSGAVAQQLRGSTS